MQFPQLIPRWKVRYYGPQSMVISSSWLAVHQDDCWIWNTMKEVTSLIEHLLWYRNPALAPDALFNFVSGTTWCSHMMFIVISLCVWMVFWKQSATYPHNWSLHLLMSATVVTGRSFQVNWWSLVKLRTQWGNSFIIFLDWDQEHTSFMEDLTLLKCQRATSWSIH